MTWEEIIIKSRNESAKIDIIYLSYLSGDLVKNQKRFKQSEEFQETLRIINELFPEKKDLKILDIGAGNGISCISFAQEGFEVFALEPDPGITVGRGAIKELAIHFKLNLEIIDGFGEKLPFENNSFDLVYARQTLHHAHNINAFLNECFRVLRKTGHMISVRDHVVYNRKDKVRFFTSHPFHKYYGGENAYKLSEYKKSYRQAGFIINKTFSHYDSVINYYPMTRQEFDDYPMTMKTNFRNKLKHTFGFLGNTQILLFLFRLYKGFFPSWYNEKKISGRLYSFLVSKN